jgi:hypothetical protein
MVGRGHVASGEDVIGVVTYTSSLAGSAPLGSSDRRGQTLKRFPCVPR